MMASFMSYFGAGRKDPKQTARDAIIGLRQQLQLIEKKAAHLQQQIEEFTKTARANAVSNKSAATHALKRKKIAEQDLDRLAGTRLQIEMQLNTLENANLNAETLAAMKKGAAALKVIHGKDTIGKVDETMNEVNEQMEHAQEIADALANPVAMGVQLDEDELKAELEELQEDVLNQRLSEADHVPVHLPPGSRADEKLQAPAAPLALEDDEEAQLKQLQAELAM